jgi:hypothetical protein
LGGVLANLEFSLSIENIGSLIIIIITIIIIGI